MLANVCASARDYFFDNTSTVNGVIEAATVLGSASATWRRGRSGEGRLAASHFIGFAVL